MQRTLTLLAGAALALLLAGCGGPDGYPEVACENGNGVEVFCGFPSGPEDIVPVPPDNRFLIVSRLTFLNPQPGVFSLFDTQTQSRSDLPVHMGEAQDQDWGDPDCAPPPSLDFDSHGLWMHRLPEGILQLLAVTHYPREAIEMFEVVTNRRDRRQKLLLWRGCLVPPENSYANDVAVTSEGRVVFTRMFELGTSIWQLLLRNALGLSTGWLWSWTKDGGYQRIPNTDGLMPNGVAVGDDPNRVFVNYYSGDMRVYDLRSGEMLKEYEVQSPDNLYVHDGHVYIASHENTTGEGLACEGRETSCPLPYAIHRVNVDTLEGKKVFSHPGTPFGVATVAVPVGDWVWMGSYIGDRIARVPFSALEK